MPAYAERHNLDRIMEASSLNGHRTLPRLASCLVLSFCLHAAALAALSVTGSAPLAGNESPMILSVRLSVHASPTNSPQPTRETKTSRRTVEAATHVDVHEHASPRIAESNPVVASVADEPERRATPVTPTNHTAPKVEPVALAVPAVRATAVEPAATPSAVDTETARAQIRALLLTDLARHFKYPPLARRQNWEGTVMLALTIKADGALSHVHVTRSSGYEVLDRSAVHTLQEAGQLTDAHAWLGGHSLELLLPVVYRLTE